MNALDERIFAAARLLKAHQFDDVIPILMRGQARHKAEHKTKRKRGVQVKIFGRINATLDADRVAEMTETRFVKDNRKDWQ